MGFIITAPTAVPVNLDGSQLSATWAESAGPFTTPTMLATGYVALNEPAASDWNYVWQLDARWTRALRDRTVFSDEGLFTTCILSQGTWNIEGGTLDITLTPTRIVVDVNSDGGTIVEIKAPLGSPETLAANTDTYVDLDEAGGYTLAAVPNGNPAPAVTAGHARIYKLVTDATELVSAGLVQGVASFPCLGPTVGAATMYITDLFAVGPADFGSDVVIHGELNVESPATFDQDITVVGQGAFSSNITVATSAAVGYMIMASSGSTLPAVAGGMRFNDTFWSVNDPSGGAHTLSDPKRSFDDAHAAGGAITLTNAVATRRIKPSEPVCITATCVYQHDTNDRDITLQVEANYSGGTATIATTTMNAAIAARNYSGVVVFRWIPTDDFAVATTENYQLRLYLGTLLGNMTATFMSITVESAIDT